MAAQLPLWLDHISFDELRAGGYIDLDQPFRDELSASEIHPLFGPSQWINIDQQSLDLLEPTFKLASKLLAHPRILLFWHALMNNRRFIRSRRLAGMFGRKCERFDPKPEPLSAQESNKVLEALEGLCHGHRFMFVAEAELPGADATTDRSGLFTLPGVPVIQPQGGYQVRHASTSRISARYLETLQRYDHASSYASPRPGTVPSPDDLPTTASILRTCFHLAKTLVHELCHAINWAFTHYDERSRVPEIRIKIEPFFMDQIRCEVGRAWESFVFGGQVDGIGDGLGMQYGISVSKWPHPFCDEGQARAPIRSPFRTSYAIPMAWVQRLWTAGFWQDVERYGLQELRPAKLLGLRRTVTAGPVAVLLSDEAEQWLECFSDDEANSELSNAARAALVQRCMQAQVNELVGAGDADSSDSSVLRYADAQGVVRD